MNVAVQRLYNQQLEQTRCKTPVDVVAWLGAVQSQEYLSAKWGLWLRLSGVTDDEIEQAFTDGRILRTHVMRPTWHFVTPDDIRWLLMLTAPRVHRFNAHYYRKLELDDDVLKRSNATLIKALQGGQQLTRAELSLELQKAGISTEDLRLGYLMMYAELEGVICSGARRRKQFTYALIEERAPHARTLTKDEALVELTKRYFTGHGPATIEDFAWWSGLTKAEIKRGLEMSKPDIVQEAIDGRAHWLNPSLPAGKTITHTALLLPAYDEYTIAYKNHDAILDPSYLDMAKSAVYNGVIAMNGQLVGNWKRTLEKKQVMIETALFRPLSESEHEALVATAQRYGEYQGLDVVLQ